MAAKKKTTRTATKKTKGGGEKKSTSNYTLHVVSDSTGSLARHMVTAVLTQFPALDFQVVYHVFKDKREEMEEVVEQLKRRKTIVLYAVVDPDNKALLHNACSSMKIPHYDLTGSLVQFLADHTQQAPANELARLHAVDEGYYRRIEAMEFTAQHDDSRRIESIGEADIVIVGLSRVSKSPTSTYLGALGYRVANVSIDRATGFPPELDRVKKKTIAFTTTPRRLFETRRRRFEAFMEKISNHELDELPYTDLRSVVDEVVYAEREYRKREYPIIDISDRVVEELAGMVLKELKVKKKPLNYG